jgi:hypothetical protein
MADRRKPNGGPIGHSSTPHVRLSLVKHKHEPGMIDRSRPTNWFLIAVLVGVLVLWALIVVAVVREFT